MFLMTSAIEEVCRKATTSRPYEFNVTTLELAKEVTKQNQKVRVIKNENGFSVELISSQPNSTISINMGAIYDVAGVISNNAFAKTQYGKVADSYLFKLLYDVKDRHLNYIENGVPSLKCVLSAPCMVCGLVLPLKNLTIDHQRPQSGGELEAVLKTFRALGLTEEGPQGPKGQAILQLIRNNIPLQAVPTLPGRGVLGGNSRENRYTLNRDGLILYSFMVAAQKKDELKSQSMHSLFNLKPACQRCNSARGNPQKF